MESSIRFYSLPLFFTALFIHCPVYGHPVFDICADFILLLLIILIQIDHLRFLHTSKYR